MTGNQSSAAVLLTLFAASHLVLTTLAYADSTSEAAVEPAIETVDLGAPGEHHRHLKSLIGKWNYTMQIWNSPDGQPVELTGTSDARWILGKRFVETKFRGEFQGRSFEARSIDGYDNVKEIYTNIWHDNLGTYLVVSEGTCTADGTVRTVSFEFDDPGSGLTLTNEKVITVIDINTTQTESFIKSPSGVSFKNMALKSTRAKPKTAANSEGSD